MTNNGNTFYFLRHGETIKDPDVPAVEWTLTEETEQALEKIASEDWVQNINHIYASTEHKAQKSAAPFSEKLNLEVKIQDGLEEVHRGSAYLTDEEFKALKREKLEQRDSNKDEGESSNEALQRFISAIEAINEGHKDSNLLIVSHGTVLSLYFSHLKDDFEQIFDYWQNMDFCAVGSVKDGQVTKDISKA